MQRKARHNIQRILEEQEKMNNELERKKRKIDEWSRELNKREALTEHEKQKLEEDKKKVGAYLYSCVLTSVQVSMLLKDLRKEKDPVSSISFAINKPGDHLVFS